MRRRGLILGEVSPGGPETNHENQSTLPASGRQLTLGPPKYEAGVMPARLRRSVCNKQVLSSENAHFSFTPIKWKG
jgi:hypothetical protein